jgi:hypothetical protein
MVNVFDDFDKRQEHARRFSDICRPGETPLYALPHKGRDVSAHEDTPTTLQSRLADDLLEICSPLRR